MKKKTTIIIGLSAAGIAALTKLRALDKECRIIALCSEAELPYNKCLLADYLGQEKTEQQVYIRTANFFADNAIEVYFDTKVIAIDTVKQYITCADGKTMPYDQLLISTGLASIIPALQGVDAQGVFTFQTLADTHKILQYLQSQPVKTAVIIGAGLSGLEAADALLSHGIQIHCIEMGAHVLGRQVDHGGALFLEQAFSRCGVQLHMQNKVTEITSNQGRVSGVVLQEGEHIAADLVIITVAARVEKGLFENTGLSFEGNGLRTNEYLQTSISTIWAAGDVCAVKDQLTQEFVQSCTWPDAVMQGMVAGSCMAGALQRYPGALIIANSHMLGMDFLSCGPMNLPGRDMRVFLHKTDSSYASFLINDQGLLKGFLMIGSTKGIAAIKRALLMQQLVSEQDILSWHS